MMRKIVVVAAVGTLLAAGSAVGSATAADLPLKAPTPVPDYIYNWTGFYVGIQTGGGWDSPNWYADPTGGPTGASPAGFHDALYKASGAYGGGQIGFNYQFGRYVVGAQADFDGASIVGSAQCAPPVTGVVNCSSRINELGTATARIGGTYDRALFYSFGGWAWENERLSAACPVCGVGGTPTNAVFSGGRSGWTAGVGLEYALAGPWTHWSLVLQYNYINFGTSNLRFNITPAVPRAFFTENVIETMNVAKVGLNYRFGFGPIYAKD